jgi:hypothetical protein
MTVLDSNGKPFTGKGPFTVENGYSLAEILYSRFLQSLLVLFLIFETVGLSQMFLIGITNNYGQGYDVPVRITFLGITFTEPPD